MTEQKSGTRGRDDGGLQDAQATPSQSGSSGGATARHIGTRDEEENATGADPEPTRVTKRDKVQPATKSRSDMKAHRNSGCAALI